MILLWKKKSLSSWKLYFSCWSDANLRFFSTETELGKNKEMLIQPWNKFDDQYY